MPCQHPGKVLLQQYMEPQKISQNRLARAIKVPPRRINEIVHEKRAVTADTAVRLAIYFGGSASYWLHLQAEFEIQKIKQQISIQLSTIQSAQPQSTLKNMGKNITAYLPGTARSSPTKSANNLKKRIMR